MTRLFAALWPPPEVLQRLAQLDRPAIEGLRWTTEDQWHVTLQFLGETSESQMADAMRTARWGRPLRMTLGPTVALLSSEIVCLPAAAPGLGSLARRVGEVTGILRTNRFNGHLTLARARNKVPRPVLEGLKGTDFQAAWTADTVALVRSRLEPGGARYETVEEFGLSR